MHDCTSTDFDRLSYNDLVIYSSALCVQILCSSGLSLDALDDSSAKVAESNLCTFHQFIMIIEFFSLECVGISAKCQFAMKGIKKLMECSIIEDRQRRTLHILINDKLSPSAHCCHHQYDHHHKSLLTRAQPIIFTIWYNMHPLLNICL